MGKRFLNEKTKDVFLGSNAIDKLNEVLSAYMPYQKVMMITTSKMKEKYNSYYETLLKQIKNPNLEYVFAKKVNANKEAASKFLGEVTEEVACLVVFGSGQIIELVKVVAFIREIPYIIVPTTHVEPQHFLKTAKLKVNDLMQCYKVNAPLAVLLEESLMTAQNKISVIHTFCNVVSVSMQLLDEFLVNVSAGSTLFPKHFHALKQIIYETLAMQNELYNYSKKATLLLMNQSLKMGLIMQSLNPTNIDSATLCSNAFFKLRKKTKVPYSYYKIVHGLFLVNIYESFIKTLKINNFFSANVQSRLKMGKKFCSEHALKNNLVENLVECEHLKLSCYQMKEYEDEIIKELNEVRQILKSAYTVLKRMNLPLSYYVEKTLNIDDIKLSICLAPDLTKTDNFLKIMCRFGVLDYAF